MQNLKKELEKALLKKNYKNANRFYEICYDVLFEKIFFIANSFSKSMAEDLTQDYFVKILGIKIAKFEKHKDYIEKYLVKIAYNAFNDFVRQNKNSITLIIIESETIRQNNFLLNKKSVDELADLYNLFIKLGYAKLLSEEQNMAIKRKIEGYSIKEIATEMEKSEGAVKNLIYRAKKIIKGKMEHEP